jgi:hypothetical protein
MMERRAAAIRRERASSEREGSMCRFESGGVRRPQLVKCEGEGSVLSVLMGTRRLDRRAGMDFVV